MFNPFQTNSNSHSQEFQSIIEKNSIVELQQFLKQSAVNLNEPFVNRNFNKQTPLSYVLAQSNCNVEILKILLQSGSDPNSESRDSSLYFAFTNNRSNEILKLLIQYGATLNDNKSRNRFRSEYERILSEVNQERIQQRIQHRIQQFESEATEKENLKWSQTKAADVERLLGEKKKQLHDWLEQYHTPTEIKKQLTEGNIPIGCWQVFAEFLQSKNSREESIMKKINENSQELTKIDQKIQTLNNQREQLESQNESLQLALKSSQSIQLECKIVETYSQVEKQICNDFDEKFQSDHWNFSNLTPVDLSVALNRAKLFSVVKEIQKKNPTSGNCAKLKATLRGGGLMLNQFSLVQKKQLLLCLDCLMNHQSYEQHLEKCGVCGEHDLQAILEEYHISKFPVCFLSPRHLPYVSADDLLDMNLSTEDTDKILDQLGPLVQNHFATWE